MTKKAKGKNPQSLRTKKMRNLAQKADPKAKERKNKMDRSI